MGLDIGDIAFGVGRITGITVEGVGERGVFRITALDVSVSHIGHMGLDIGDIAFSVGRITGITVEDISEIGVLRIAALNFGESRIIGLIRDLKRDFDSIKTNHALGAGQHIRSLARRGKRGNIPGRAFRTAMPEQEIAIVEN